MSQKTDEKWEAPGSGAMRASGYSVRSEIISHTMVEDERNNMKYEVPMFLGRCIDISVNVIGRLFGNIDYALVT